MRRKRKRAGSLRIDRKLPAMEAAGIEPASRDISVVASTCVVGCLGFALKAPNRRGASSASRQRNLIPGVADSDPGRAGIDGRLLGLSGESLSRDCEFLRSHYEVIFGN